MNEGAAAGDVVSGEALRDRVYQKETPLKNAESVNQNADQPKPTKKGVKKIIELLEILGMQYL